MNNLKKRDQYIQEELKPWSDKPDAEDMERSRKFRERYKKHMIDREQKEKSFSIEDLKKAFNDGKLYGDNELELDTEGRETAFEVWFENNYGKANNEFDESDGGGWVSKWNKIPLKENMLPKPYKKVKCNECGEEVCDNINFKIGHLYNKHNCKPSVGDYKAKRMMVQYFLPTK